MTADFVSSIMSALEKEMKNIGHVNIIVAGKTGVGKSTLINSIFREKLAETGIGAPVTQTIKELTKKDFPLRVYDSIGLELGSDRQQQVEDDINKVINDALTKGDEDKFIHCIWYCINVNSNRIEPREEEFIDRLARDNKNTGVPVIIVLTIAHNKTLSLEMKEYIDKLNLNVQGTFIVLAEDYKDEDFVRKAYGGSELVEFTSSILPESAQKAFVNAQSVSFKLKRDKAQAIVVTTVAVSFGAGFTPIPFSDAVLLVPTQVGMIAGITAVYGMKISKSTMTAIVASLAGTTGATVLGKTIVSNLIKMIPGVGTVVGGVISGTTAAALTTALGGTYIVIMEMLVKGELSESDITSGKAKKLMMDIFQKQAKEKSNAGNNKGKIRELINKPFKKKANITQQS
jgi:uncharacterized protein (DUF697 family)/GTP-binding protein EngB required for normal cell division